MSAHAATHIHARSIHSDLHLHHHHLEASSKCSQGIFNIEQADGFARPLNPKAHMGPQDHLQSVNKHVHIQYYRVWHQFITVYEESERKGRKKLHYLSRQEKGFGLYMIFKTTRVIKVRAGLLLSYESLCDNACMRAACFSCVQPGR